MFFELFKLCFVDNFMRLAMLYKTLFLNFGINLIYFLE